MAPGPSRRGWLRSTAAVVLVVLTAVGAAVDADAHPMPESVVEMSIRDTGIDARLELPVEDLALAGAPDLRGDDAPVVLAERTVDLRTYLADHLRLESTDGREWSVAIGQPTLSEAVSTTTGPYREVVVDATLTPPPGADVRRFVIVSAPIVHRVVTHTVLISIADDWAGGRISEDDRPAERIATVTVDRRSMQIVPTVIDLDDGSSWAGFVAMVRLGAAHILGGADHLLFLLVLLLPAPLIARARRWDGPIGSRRAALRIAAITAAFTIGHSATLAITAVARIAPPAVPIEVLIALSIGVGAMHALRPIFPGREAVIAGLFGLIHGMAFSFTLAELGLSSSQLVVSLLGFNLGIELMQIAVVLVTLPSLLLLARTTWYRPVRIIGGLAAAIAAAGWLLDRLGYPNPVADLADRVGTVGWVPIIGLAALALVATRVAPRSNDGAVPEPTSAPTGNSDTAGASGSPGR